MARHRCGMTLIELVVAMALLVVLLSMSFGVIGAFYRESAAQTQESALQQNFRFAVASISNDLREAQDIDRPGAIPTGNLIMGEVLTLDLQDHAPLSAQTVTYKTVPASGGLYRLVRAVHNINGPETQEAVTEDIPELVKTYFLYSADKVYVMMVGKTVSYGRQSLVSLVSLVYARNLGQLQ